MSFFRVSNPVAAALSIDDLGIVIAASAANVVLSNQFSVNDLYLSADLEAAIIAGDLTVQIDYGTGFAAIAALDYTNRDALASFLNIYEITNEDDNEELVGGGDTSLHKHDGLYYTETELGGVGGGALIGLDDTAWNSLITFTTVQGFADQLQGLIAGFDLDDVYTNDADGIMNVNGVAKDLNLRSDNVNDIVVSRIDGADIQDALLFDVSADQLILGSAVVGALAEIDVRVLTNLIVDGNLTITGTLTDTTVDLLNIANANIRLRDGADAIAGANAYIEVERGTSGNDARLEWDEALDRWLAGTVGDMNTIALLEVDEVVTGVWEFQGGAVTEPSMYLTDKAAAPTTELGAAGQVPLSMIGNTLAFYDKTNARDKWLSVYRMHLGFSGRDNGNNSNEYARFGLMTSNQSSARLLENMTLIGISIQTNGASTWTARVRKNDAPADLASLAVTALAGAQNSAQNVDFDAGDKIEVFIDGTGVNRPIIVLEFAERF